MSGIMDFLRRSYGAQPVERASILPLARDVQGGLMFALPEFIESARRIGYSAGGQGPSPMDAAGNVSPQAIEDAFNVAADLGAGGLMGSSRRGLMGDRSAVTGIFGGPGARTADHFALSRAEELAAGGASKNRIFDETGWFQGPDGQWRFEISDDRSVYKTGVAPQQKSRIGRAMEYFEEAGLPREKFATPDFREETDRALEMADRAKPRLEAVEIQNAFEHPDLWAAYPDLARIPYGEGASDILGGAQGGYIPGSDAIVTDIPTISYKTDPRSTILHELQHAIQQREGFAKGSSPERAKMEAYSALGKEVGKHSSDAFKFDEALETVKPIWRAQYIDRLDRMMERDSLKPSEVFRMSDWYSLSPLVSERLGKMPKKPGPARDEWLRGAVAIFKAEYMKELGATDAANVRRLMEDVYKTPKDRTNAARRYERVMDKFRDAANKRQEINSKQDELGRISDMEAYKRAAGEVEARAVQERMNWPPSERTGTPPWFTYDKAPENQYVFGVGKKL